MCISHCMCGMLLKPEMMPYKIVNNNNSPVSIQYYLHMLFFWPVYYGNQRCHLKNNNKKGAFVLFTCVIFSGCQLVHCSLKITPIATNYSNIYIFFKFKIDTEKYIHLKWVFFHKVLLTAVNETDVLIGYF